MKGRLPIWTVMMITWLFLSQCGGSSQGGTEAGNPPASRTVTGTVSPDSSALQAASLSAADCGADTIIATDTSAQSTMASLDEDCVFTIDLSTGKAYALSFVLNDAFVASMIFTNSATLFESSYMLVSAGNGIVDLGMVSILSGIATPSNQPASFFDWDEDGSFDFDDEDDDNDGVADDDEEDCDLDGLDNDYDEDACEEEDEDDSSDDAEDALAEVLEVLPANDTTFTNTSRYVDLDQQVRLRFSCEIEPDSFDETTFEILSEDDEVIAWECEFSDDEVECEHEDFEPLTIYTATVSGVLCDDGREVSAESWSWKTKDE